MGIIFNFNDSDNLHPGAEITFSSLEFIVDRYGVLRLQEPKPVIPKAEEPSSIYMFVQGFEDVVATGAPTLTQYMDLSSGLLQQSLHAHPRPSHQLHEGIPQLGSLCRKRKANMWHPEQFLDQLNEEVTRVTVGEVLLWNGMKKTNHQNVWVAGTRVQQRQSGSSIHTFGASKKHKWFRI